MAKYSKKIVTQICELISKDSYTIAEICLQVKISESTYYEWLKTKSDFSEAIKKAQDQFTQDMLVECSKSLVKLIKGYTAEETKIVYVDSKVKEIGDDGQEVVKSKPKIKEQVTTKKHIAPSLGAIIHFQTNRDPDNWKNRQENKVSGDIGIKSSLENLSDEQLQKIINGDEVK
mgnify:CR=1 FL=1